MSEQRQMKKINLDTLEQAERKVSVSKLKKGVVALVLLLAVAGGGYGAYRIVSGEVVGSRFTVDKMNCPACVITVKEVTGKLPGVVGTKVSLAAKDVTVEYREKQTSAEQIKTAIAGAGYPIKLDGMFKLDGGGINEVVVATVNEKPVFAKDLKIPFDVTDKASQSREEASVLFSVVGKEILLQAADKETVVVQPFEIEEEVDKIFKSHGVTKEEFESWIQQNYGSREKFHQMVGQRLGIRRYLDDYVLEGVKNPEERQHKTLELLGTLFKDADVKIRDAKFREKILASVGQDNWKTFWPRMIGSQTDLKGLLLQ